MMKLENKNISVIVRPDLGGRMDSIRDSLTGREWLYHAGSPELRQGRNLSLGASFDDNWTGGWDEIFPNDAAGEFQGRQLVDHGELWSQKWDVVEHSSQAVQMFLECRTVPVTVQKTVLLDSEKAKGTVRYVFTNKSGENIPFLFKMHAALAVEPGDEILLPDCQIEPVDLGFSQIIGRSVKTSFPKAYDKEGRQIDVSRVPPRESRTREFYYSTELSEGRCGLKNLRSKARFVLEFDRTHFPTVWNFQSYGGWNGHYMAVLEPCTTIPWDLKKAFENQTCAILGPQEVQERWMSFSIEMTDS